VAIPTGVGGTVGAFVPFYVFRDTRLGRTDWIRSRLHLSEARVDRGRAWFRKWGESSVL
jgi:membrane protein DedA with SNARE-associated domain